jgi:hypothetical protein
MCMPGPVRRPDAPCPWHVGDGFEAEYLVSAQDLFKPEEATLAVQHAEECYRAASALRYYDREKLAALLSGR